MEMIHILIAVIGLITVHWAFLLFLRNDINAVVRRTSSYTIAHVYFYSNGWWWRYQHCAHHCCVLRSRWSSTNYHHRHHRHLCYQKA